MKTFQSTPQGPVRVYARGPVLEYKLSFIPLMNTREELEGLKRAFIVVIQAHKNPTPAGGLAPRAPTLGVPDAGTPAALAMRQHLAGDGI